MSSAPLGEVTAAATTIKKLALAKSRAAIVLSDEECERWGLAEILRQFAGQAYSLDTVVQAYAQALQGKAAQRENAHTAACAKKSLEALASEYELVSFGATPYAGQATGRMAERLKKLVGKHAVFTAVTPAAVITVDSPNAVLAAAAAAVKYYSTPPGIKRAIKPKPAPAAPTEAASPPPAEPTVKYYFTPPDIKGAIRPKSKPAPAASIEAAHPPLAGPTATTAPVPSKAAIPTKVSRRPAATILRAPLQPKVVSADSPAAKTTVTKAKPAAQAPIIPSHASPKLALSPEPEEEGSEIEAAIKRLRRARAERRGKDARIKKWLPTPQPRPALG